MAKQRCNIDENEIASFISQTEETNHSAACSIVLQEISCTAFLDVFKYRTKLQGRDLWHLNIAHGEEMEKCQKCCPIHTAFYL